MVMNDWDWQLFPETQKIVSGSIRSFLDGNGYADVIGKEIEATTSTRFIDWVDSLEIPDVVMSGKDLERIGYQKDSRISAEGTVYVHPGKFFPIVLRADGSYRLSIGVDDLDRFLTMGHLNNKVIEGERNSPLRSAELNREGDFSFGAKERHGRRTFDVRPSTDIIEYEKALNAFTERNRTYADDEEGLIGLEALIADLGDSLDKGRLSDAFFRAERTYWKSKNRAGAVQFMRQELMGLGWGNHDHHTFRCSRENFGRAIDIFERLGMTRRESFIAGAEAGWGAQVMEQPDSGLVVFADVDLGRDEVRRDFVNQTLKPLERLGTVGLWVGLHGESLLDSGMHHLAIGSDFEGMLNDLKTRNVVSMRPFSDFQFLKQSFTEAERWKPPKGRIERLLEGKLITKEQGSGFFEHGAVGSHLEIIQREQGFKGFNQTSVSAIIRLTDPMRRTEIGA
jgi:hypothetical protein